MRLMHAVRKLQLRKKIVEKITNLVAADARFTTSRIAKCIGISVGAAQTILRRDLKMRRISARWIPHLVTKEQKLARVRIAKQLLKQFPKYNNRSFANIIIGDENVGSLFTSPSERYKTKYGQPKEAKHLA